MLVTGHIRVFINLFLSLLSLLFPSSSCFDLLSFPFSIFIYKAATSIASPAGTAIPATASGPIVAAAAAFVDPPLLPLLVWLAPLAPVPLPLPVLPPEDPPDELPEPEPPEPDPPEVVAPAVMVMACWNCEMRVGPKVVVTEVVRAVPLSAE